MHLQKLESRPLIVAGLSSLFLSTLFLLMTYPGMLSMDSVNSWRQAASNHFYTIKPPFLAIIQSIVLRFLPLDEAVPIFTFVQGFLYWFAIFLLLALIADKFRPFLIACLGVALLPPIWAFTATQWTDVWVVIFLLLAFSFCWLLHQDEYANKTYLAFACICIFLAVATRHNAVSALPIFIFPLSKALKKIWGFRRGLHVGLAAVLTAGLFLASSLISMLPGVEKSGPMLPFTLANQYVGTIAHSDPEKKQQLLAQEAPLFDALFAPAQLSEVVELYKPGFSDGTLYGKNAIRLFSRNSVVPGSTHDLRGKFMIRAFFRVLRSSPEGYFRHKIAYLKGIFGRRSLERVPFSLGVADNDLGIRSEPILERAKSALVTFMSPITKTILFEHWFMFILGFIAVLLNSRTARNPAVFWLVGGAVLYAVPYAILSVHWEWRYLLPSYLMNWLAVIIACLGLTFPSASWAPTRKDQPNALPTP